MTLKSLTMRVDANPSPAEDEWEPPSYKTPGRMLVYIPVIVPEGLRYRYDCYEDAEVVSYDDDSCVFWINEGVGFDWWLEEHFDVELPGWYVLEGVVGHYIKGDWGFTDDDEEWEFALCRRATEEEIATQCLA